MRWLMAALVMLAGCAEPYEGVFGELPTRTFLVGSDPCHEDICFLGDGQEGAGPHQIMSLPEAPGLLEVGDAFIAFTLDRQLWVVDLDSRELIWLDEMVDELAANSSDLAYTTQWTPRGILNWWHYGDRQAREVDTGIDAAISILELIDGHVYATTWVSASTQSGHLYAIEPGGDWQLLREATFPGRFEVSVQEKFLLLAENLDEGSNLLRVDRDQVSQSPIFRRDSAMTSLTATDVVAAWQESSGTYLAHPWTGDVERIGTARPLASYERTVFVDDDGALRAVSMQGDKGVVPGVAGRSIEGTDTVGDRLWFAYGGDEPRVMRIWMPVHQVHGELKQ